MARQPRDPRQRLDRPGQRPLLQGHLRAGGKSSVVQRSTNDGTAADETPSAQPAREGTAGEADGERGKATRSPAETATRRNLEGSEQGPA